MYPHGGLTLWYKAVGRDMDQLVGLGLGLVRVLGTVPLRIPLRGMWVLLVPGTIFTIKLLQLLRILCGLLLYLDGGILYFSGILHWGVLLRALILGWRILIMLLDGQHRPILGLGLGPAIQVLLALTRNGGTLTLIIRSGLVGPTPVILRGSVLGALGGGQPHTGLGSIWVLLEPPLMMGAPGGVSGAGPLTSHGCPRFISRLVG
jgi:hypothetical protein